MFPPFYRVFLPKSISSIFEKLVFKIENNEFKGTYDIYFIDIISIFLMKNIKQANLFSFSNIN